MSTAESVDHTFKKDFDGMSRHAGVLKEDVSVLAHDAVQTAKSGASELREGAMRSVESAKTKLGEAADVAKDEYAVVKHKAVEIGKSLKDVMGNHPVATVGVIAGVGILVGMVLSRPRA
jgi:ElaB/YqjD/DUF883 family membrane-anchored ribosome-binding protein